MRPQIFADFNYFIQDKEIEVLNPINLLFGIEQNLKLSLDINLKLLKDESSNEAIFSGNPISMISFSNMANTYHFFYDVVTDYFYKAKNNSINFKPEEKQKIYENMLLCQRFQFTNLFDYFNPMYTYTLIDHFLNIDVSDKRDKCLALVADVKKNCRSNHIDMVKKIFLFKIFNLIYI